MISRDEQAQALAAAHYRIEAGITGIYRLLAGTEVESRPGEPIKLLEVNHDTIATGIMPLEFAPVPDQGWPFTTVIVEVTPAEFEDICHRALALPSGWQLGELLPNPSGAAVA